MESTRGKEIIDPSILSSMTWKRRDARTGCEFEVIGVCNHTAKKLERLFQTTFSKARRISSSSWE